MPGIDLYSIHKLDRRQPPEALAAQLTAQLDAVDPQDAVGRGRIETARMILGDPARRARYDAQLADPAAPPVTEDVLIQIAGRPVPTAQAAPARSGLTALPPRILATAAAALAVLLIAVIALISCGGGGDSGNTARGRLSHLTDEPAAAAGECGPMENTRINLESAESGSAANAIVLDQVIDLPSEFDRIASFDSTWNGRGLTQYQDRNIGVTVDKSEGPSMYSGSMLYEDSVFVLAVVDPAGKVVSVRDYPKAQGMPASSDLVRTGLFGYFDVVAENGIAIPAKAAGNEPNMNYVLSALPDAYDKKVVWVLLRGSSDLYKAHLVQASCVA